MAETYGDEQAVETPGDESLLTDERVKWAGMAVALAFTAVIVGFVGLVLFEYVDYELLGAVVPRFVVAFLRVVVVVVIASVLAVTAGVFVGLGRVSRTSITHAIATAYVQFFRGRRCCSSCSSSIWASRRCGRRGSSRFRRDGRFIRRFWS